jgi:pSer/pThr/pTyr-binding forkhead associated (FHA) protein
MAIWKLTIEDDEGQKTVVPLVRDEYTLGRNEGHTIRLTERNISRDHAKIRKNGEGYVLEDLGSYNGVFVNGHRVAEPTLLASGDLIIVGDYRIEAHNEAAPQRIPAPGEGPKASSRPPASKRAPALPAEKPHRLVLLTGAEGGKEYPLDKAKMIIGRGDDVDVRVNHSSVSRHHCELHILEDGTFEVRDQSSANGIRVNGQDSKRSVLQPNDLVELGDVQLKYIPAGVPFVFDAAAQSAAREVELRNERARRRSGMGTWIIVVLLVAAAAAGGVVLARQGEDKTTTVPSTTVTGGGAGSKDDVLEKALAKFNAGDPIGAYEQAKASPTARKAPEFSKIENAWAEKRLAQLAEMGDDDPTKKTGLLEIQESGADDTNKAKAASMLSAIQGPEPMPTPTTSETVEPPPVPTPTTTSTGTAPTATTTTTATTKPTATSTVTAKPTATATATTTAKPTATATTTAKPTSTATTAAPPTVGNCPSYKGDFAAASKNSDWECVRTILLPRLNAGAISSGEARYLKAACTQLGDLSCAKRAAEKI